ESRVLTSSSFIFSVYIVCCLFYFSVFFFNATPTTEIYTLSLHDALPISLRQRVADHFFGAPQNLQRIVLHPARLWVDLLMFFLRDRKSTRLNSSHSQISYAVFCLKKKTKSYIKAFPHTLSLTGAQRIMN